MHWPTAATLQPFLPSIGLDRGNNGAGDLETDHHTLPSSSLSFVSLSIFFFRCSGFANPALYGV